MAQRTWRPLRCLTQMLTRGGNLNFVGQSNSEMQLGLSQANWECGTRHKRELVCGITITTLTFWLLALQERITFWKISQCCPFCSFWAESLLFPNRTELVFSRRNSQPPCRIWPVRFLLSNWGSDFWILLEELKHFKHVMLFPFKSARFSHWKNVQAETNNMKLLIRKKKRKNSHSSHSNTCKQLLVYLFPNVISIKYQASMAIWQGWGIKIN